MSKEALHNNLLFNSLKRHKVLIQFRELILYGIIGCLSSGLDFLVFTALTSLRVYYVLANCFSVVTGIVTSFTLNRRYNFKVKDHTFKRFAIFLSVGLMGLILSTGILWMLMEKLGMDEIISKLISIFGVVIFQFLLNKFITFRKR